MVMHLLDLFSGIGGFSLGLERSGLCKTVAFCEIEKFPCQILAKHWPGVPIYNDVRTLSGKLLSRDGIRVDAICGGFPCQDISTAGLGAGIDGKRSGLWSEFARLIGEILPRYVIVENVAALLGRGIYRVLGDLAALGYDAEWHCIRASDIGAPHRRDRVWIIAYLMANSEHNRVPIGRGNKDAGEKTGKSPRVSRNDQSRSGKQTTKVLANASPIHEQGKFSSIIDAKIWEVTRERSFGSCGYGIGQWATEPALGRVANGVPHRVDRLKSLGNAVVPQIPELIGRAILEYESSLTQP